MTEEIWKNIIEYETYSVSLFGNVRNDMTGLILKPGKTKKGYLLVCLCKNKIRKTFRIHRLVASAFIPNPENKSCVDHIDNNPSNNNLTNLRWATLTENQMNRKISIDNTSGTKGVYFYKQYSKWCAQIRIHGKQTCLGYFETIESAAAARQTKALEIFGEFVNTCEKI